MSSLLFTLLTTPSTISTTTTIPPLDTTDPYSLVKVNQTDDILEIKSVYHLNGTDFNYETSINPRKFSHDKIVSPHPLSTLIPLSHSTDHNYESFSMGLSLTLTYINFIAHSQSQTLKASAIEDYLNQEFVECLVVIGRLYQSTPFRNWFLQIMEFNRVWGHLLPKSTNPNLPLIKAELLFATMATILPSKSPSISEETTKSLDSICKLTQNAEDEIYNYTKQLESSLASTVKQYLHNLNEFGGSLAHQVEASFKSIKAQAIDNLLAHVKDYFENNYHGLFDDVTQTVRRNLYNNIHPIVNEHINYINANTETLLHKLDQDSQRLRQDIAQVSNLGANLDIIDQKLLTFDQKYQSTSIISQINDLKQSLNQLQDKVDSLTSSLGL